MKRFAVGCFVLLAGIIARAGTNLPPATSLLLDEKTSIQLTAGLSQYENPPQLSGRITSVGGGSSAILVNRWAAEFARIYPDVELNSHGGGSVTGLSELIEGKVDLVPMNRPVPAEDIAHFKAKFGYEPAQIVVAQDAEAVYVNKNNPVAGLTLTQLDAIFPQRPARRRPAGILARPGRQRPAGGRVALTGSVSVASTAVICTSKRW